MKNLVRKASKNTCPKEERADCIGNTLEVLGEKWTAIALQLMDESPKTFSQLEVELEGISPRTLSARLKKLIEEKIVTKNAYTKHPLRYKYSLTNKGQELHAVLIAMANWGNRYAD
jgi:DNA-binding HxlR family transcriptional regulator